MSTEPDRDCVACKAPLRYVGIKNLRTGGSEGLLASFGEITETHLTIALYGCPKCGRLEMFLPPTAK